MLIGYIRVSKQDGSQCLELQNDALIKAGVTPVRICKWRWVIKRTRAGSA